MNDLSYGQTVWMIICISMLGLVALFSAGVCIYVDVLMFSDPMNYLAACILLNLFCLGLLVLLLVAWRGRVQHQAGENTFLLDP